jgi:hypothetical protein
VSAHERIRVGRRSGWWGTYWRGDCPACGWIGPASGPEVAILAADRHARACPSACPSCKLFGKVAPACPTCQGYGWVKEPAA